MSYSSGTVPYWLGRLASDIWLMKKYLRQHESCKLRGKLNTGLTGSVFAYQEHWSHSPTEHWYPWLLCQQIDHWLRPRQTSTRDHLHIVLQPLALNCRYATWYCPRTWAQSQAWKKYAHFRLEHTWTMIEIGWFALKVYQYKHLDWYEIVCIVFSTFLSNHFQTRQLYWF